MEFENPISIKELKTDSLNIENRYGETGTLVACRPCDEQYKDKTYLGFYLGELPAMQWPSVNKDEQKIQMMTIRNPAMFVPEIGKVIWGAGSWWKIINSVEEFREITNEDINNTWYVQLARAIEKKEDNDKEN